MRAQDGLMYGYLATAPFTHFGSKFTRRLPWRAVLGKKQKSLSVVYQGELNSFSQDTRCLTDRGDGHVVEIFIEETVQG